MKDVKPMECMNKGYMKWKKLEVKRKKDKYLGLCLILWTLIKNSHKLNKLFWIVYLDNDVLDVGQFGYICFYLFYFYLENHHNYKNFFLPNDWEENICI